MKTIFNDNNMQPTPPPIRDIDTIIAGMEATGKCSKNFLVSLRKGMERSQTFQCSKTLFIKSDLRSKVF